MPVLVLTLAHWVHVLTGLMSPTVLVISDNVVHELLNACHAMHIAHQQRCRLFATTAADAGCGLDADQACRMVVISLCVPVRGVTGNYAIDPGAVVYK